MSIPRRSADLGPRWSSLTREPLSPDRAGDLARMFKALGDPARLRLLSMVASHEGGEVCVCDLTPAFDLSQPTISHHLKVLREAGLLDCERRGTWVHYRVVPGALARLAAVLGPMDAIGPSDGIDPIDPSDPRLPTTPTAGAQQVRR